jgi:hypothetical protein
MTMKTPLKTFALIAGGAALALAGSAASASHISAKDRQNGEARLARMLAGRTASEPVSCINTLRTNRVEVIDGVAVVYNAGRTIWVARPLDPNMLGRNDAVVMDRFSPSRLCVQEPMRTIDRYDHYNTGVLFLKDFVPYTRAD